jgi:hypothetical protein
MNTISNTSKGGMRIEYRNNIGNDKEKRRRGGCF